LARAWAAIAAVTLFSRADQCYVVAGIACIGSGVFSIGVKSCPEKSINAGHCEACCIACYTVVDAQGVRAPHAGKLHRLDFF